MAFGCFNCEFMLSQMEDRTVNFREVTLENHKLRETVAKQEDIIFFLKMRLCERRENLMVEYYNKVSEENKPLNSQISNKLEEMDSFIKALTAERLSALEVVAEHEANYYENMRCLKKMIEFYRTTVLSVMEEADRFKQYYKLKYDENLKTAQETFIAKFNEERHKVTNEMQERYTAALAHANGEIHKQAQLVFRLRNYNRQVYNNLLDTHKKKEAEINELTESMDKLKVQMDQMRGKISFLQTQIAAKVDGCNNEIQTTKRYLYDIKRNSKK